jgi:5-methyltetrahydrofolate--homocysteine methyltransferase
VEELTRGALGESISAAEILNGGLLAGMDVVGQRFGEGELFIPEVLYSAKAMSAGMEVLKPLLLGQASLRQGTVILGTVKGDIHDLGKNLVGVMLTAAGFEVIDLGVNVPPQKFSEAVAEKRPEVVGLSALLTMTMPAMKTTLEELDRAGLRSQVKTIIGGATVTQRYADEIGADGYAKDALSAVTKVRELLNLSQGS